MKKIIINEEQLKYILNEIKIDGYDENVVNRYIKLGYLVHGTNEDFDKFDQSKIKGGTRGEYGYGMYFTNTAYKALEYGCTIYITKEDIYNFLDLRTRDMSFINKFVDIEQELIILQDKLDNSRNVREYDYYNKAIENLKSKLPFLTFNEEIVLNKFKQIMDKYPDTTLENIYKGVRGDLPGGYDKYMSSLLLKFGYDGVKCYNQYVIFNFDLLNDNLLKDVNE